MLCLLLPGCWSSIPLTLNELQDYITEKEQSFTVPAYKLIGASLYSLKQMGFELELIVYHPSKASVHAEWQETGVYIDFLSNTPYLTTAKSRITTNQVGREHAIEEELYHNIRLNLDRIPSPDVGSQTAGMVRVYAQTSLESDIIAFLKPGTVITVADSRDGWTKLELDNGITGFVLGNISDISD